MFTIQDYIDSLKSDKQKLVTNLTTKGISGLTGNETFTELAPMVLDIVTPNNQSKSETITSNTTTLIEPDTGYTGLSSVSITTNIQMDLSDYFGTTYTSYPYDLIKKFGYAITPSSTNMNSAFMNWKGLVEAPSLTINPINISNMFSGCTELVEVPIYNTSALLQASGTFNNCLKLSDSALDNILQMCASVTSSYVGDKKLSFLGITNATYYPTSRIEALPHYNDFITAGWTIS